MTDEARRALLFVAAFRAKHGHGPTWKELREAMHWTWRDGVGYREANQRIRGLYGAGLRWRSLVERSLNVEPHALAGLLRELRETRVA